MKITNVDVYPVKQTKKNKSLMAFASITFDKVFVVKNIRIVDGKKGLFVSMPSQQGSDEKYYDVAFPLTAEFREEISDAVLEAFDEENEKPKKSSRKSSKAKKVEEDDEEEDD